MITRRKSKRSQSAVEFIIILGFILFFFVVFFSIIGKNEAQKNKEKENLILQNIALDVKDEINLAAQASEGYFREFKIPLNVLGTDYDIQIIDERVYINTSSFGVSYAVVSVNGLLQKGDNNITKQNGEVYLNQ
jgi:hypothetical protein